MNLNPSILWAQDRATLFITIEINNFIASIYNEIISQFVHTGLCLFSVVRHFFDR